MANITIRKFNERFAKGDFDHPSVAVQCDAGWFDWFCRDASLVNKTKVLGKKVAQISNSPKVNVDGQYVFFKNNCPLSGPIYDDFRICDLESGDVIYTIVPKNPHSKKAEVWGVENLFEGPLVEGTWSDVRRFFGV